MTQLLFLALLDGLANASLIFIVSVGLTFTFGVLRILNVAHGSFYAVGAYVTASVGAFLATDSAIMAIVILILAPLFIGAVTGPLIERFALRPIYHSEPYLQLLMTFGIFMILENLQRLIWGVQPLFFDAPVSLFGTVDVLDITYTRYQLFVLPGVALLVLVGLEFVLRRTSVGRLILAVIADREVSVTLGIDAKRIYSVAFSVGVFLAALGGTLAAPTTSVAPGLGANIIVLSFAVVASAGLGEIGGAAITAILVGLGQSFCVYFAPEVVPVVPYVFMGAVLLLRPHGLFGRPEVQRV